jgi:hypothetical protein
MEKMSISERAAYNIQTREEFEVLKKRLTSLVKYHFGENSGVECIFDGYNEYLKSADICIMFYYRDLRGDVLDDFFLRVGRMDLTVTYWCITWDKKMINIRFKW